MAVEAHRRRSRRTPTRTSRSRRRSCGRTMGWSSGSGEREVGHHREGAARRASRRTSTVRERGDPDSQEGDRGRGGIQRAREHQLVPLRRAGSSAGGASGTSGASARSSGWRADLVVRAARRLRGQDVARRAQQDRLSRGEGQRDGGLPLQGGLLCHGTLLLDADLEEAAGADQAVRGAAGKEVHEEQGDEDREHGDRRQIRLSPR